MINQKISVLAQETQDTVDGSQDKTPELIDTSENDIEPGWENESQPAGQGERNETSLSKKGKSTGESMNLNESAVELVGGTTDAIGKKYTLTRYTCRVFRQAVLVR